MLKVSTVASPITPDVGMGVTILHYSDREPATIIEMSATGKRMVVQLDNYERTDKNGMSSDQTYTYSPNLYGLKIKVALTKKGWCVSNSTSYVFIGTRRRYYDYSF